MCVVVLVFGRDYHAPPLRLGDLDLDVDLVDECAGEFPGDEELHLFGDFLDQLDMRIHVWCGWNGKPVRVVWKCAGGESRWLIPSSQLREPGWLA
jgi:hypothetical protein